MNQDKFNSMLLKMPSGYFGNRYASIEPIQGEIVITKYAGRGAGKELNWLIVGAETGNRKGKIIPKREWLLDIRPQCKELNIPLFEKNSLAPLLPEGLIQQWPEE